MRWDRQEGLGKQTALAVKVDVYPCQPDWGIAVSRLFPIPVLRKAAFLSLGFYCPDEVALSDGDER